MQKIKNYFENQKQEFTPNEKDFAFVLSKIEARSKSVQVTKRSPFMFWSFASVSFAAMILVVVSVVSPTSKQNSTLAINDSREALSTIDSVKSFDIQNDNDF